MADVNSQVALGIQAPDPNQGMNTLSKILSIGQQGLQIQGQKSKNQSLAADAAIGQQNAKEKMAGAQLLSDPVANGLIDADGNPTKDAQRIIYQAMPTTGADHYQGILNGAKSKVDFNRSVNNLNADERTEVGGMFAGAAAGAKSPDDINDAATNFLKSKEGLPTYDDFKKIVDTGSQIVNHVASKQNDSGQIIPSGQEPYRQAALGLGRQVLGAAGVVGSGGVGTPQQGTNAAGQNQLINPITGERSMPQLAGGATNPTSTTVAGNTAGTIGGVGADRERANQVSAAVAPANQTVTITKEIDDLADQVHSGKVSQAISKAAAAVGMDANTYARQLLEKDLAGLKATASASASTDQRQAGIVARFPDATSDNQTIHTAMDYARGAAKQDLARGALLNQVKSKDPNVRGFQHADDVLTGNTDPLMHEFNSLQTPQERVGFYKRNFSDPAKAKEFRDKVAGMSHLNVIGQ